MKWLGFLKVVVLATLVLISGFPLFWILETQNEIFGRTEVLHFGESLARLSNLASIRENFTRLHGAVERCLLENGDGIKVTKVQGCKIRLQYPHGTENSWVYRRPESGAQVQEAENLAWDYNLCSLMEYWKEARTHPAVVTQELFDCYLKWETTKHVQHHFVSRDSCKTTSDCFQHVRSLLPLKQPFAPGQGGRCALVGNAASLMSNVTFGDEIDAYDTVIRINDARTGDKYGNWTGHKTTFRFVNERITKALLPLIKKTPIRNETLVLRRALGGSMLRKLQAGSMGNSIYVSPIMQAGSGLEAGPILGYSSGFLALNFAISICKSVDLYGFSIDPGPQPSWPRYFSGPKFGHMPLTNRAYFLLLECLQVVRLKSAERILSGRKTTLPAAEVLHYGYTVAKTSQEESETGKEPIKLCHRSIESSTQH